jgi:iron complex outermembrane receptor protein
MKSKLRRLTGTAGALVIALSAGPALAQEAVAVAPEPTPAQPAADAAPSPAQAQAPAQAPAAQSADAGDIIVTAQRRAQRLQDVPIAVTALTGDQIGNQGVTSTHDLAQSVTGLTFTESSGYVQPFIRGIGSTVTNLGEQGTAAIYIDGVYMPSINGQLYELANIESVEVLKGPQGTLFGRNANSGAIIINTRQPQFTPEGRFQVGYGNHDAWNFQGYVSAPLIGDTVAFSVAGNYDEHDGYYTNRGDGRLGDSRRWTLRGTVLVNAAPNLSITLAGDISRVNDPSVILLQPVGGYQGFLPGGLLPDGPYDFIGDSQDVGYLVRNSGLSARVRWDLGPVELVSTTAQRWYRNQSIEYDSDTTPTLFTQINQTEVGKEFTQELQLISSRGGPFNWVVGGFYLRQDADYAPLRVVSAAGTTLITAQQVTEAYAGFADASYDFGQFEITGGLRYSYERKSYDGQLAGNPVVNDASANWDSFTPRVVLSYHPSRRVLFYGSYSRGFKSGTFNANGLSTVPVDPETVDAYELGLKLTPHPGVQLNISGFHYEISNLQVQALNPATNLIAVANAASVRSNGIDVELSLRPIQGLNLRFSGSYLDAQFTDFPNAQVYIKVPGGDGRNQSIIEDVTGNQNVRSPHWTFNASADYRIDLGRAGSLVPSANLYYSSSFFWDVGNRLREGSHVVINAGLTWNLPGDHWTVGAWVRNLTNELRFRTFTPAAQADRRLADDPRLYGIRVGYQF